MLPLDPPPEIFGSHGLERLFADGRYEVRELDEKAVAGLSEIDAMALQGGLEEHLERKPGCLALHWRGLDTRTVERMHRVVLYDWQKVAGKSGLSIFGFNGGMEVRAPLCDKGDAVRTVLEEEPEGTAIAYLGDDMTDEDAFEAVENRGLGILVAAEPRESVATIWLAPPEGVTGFLLRWADVRGGKRMKPESQRVRP